MVHLSCSLGADYTASFDDVTFTSDSGYFGGGMTNSVFTLKPEAV